MKRLMLMIAAVASAVVAFADKVAMETFETSSLGPIATNAVWNVPADAEANIANGTTWADAGTNILDVVDSPAATPVQRLFNARQQDGLSGVWSAPVPQTIPSTGLYFDSMVQFTVAEDLTVDATGAKIAVFAYCDPENQAAGTNLVARAGYYSQDGLVATNYILNAKVDASAWYRLTIKAISMGNNDYGFVVYVNEEPVAYKNDGTGATGVTGIASKYNDDKQLLPSMINTGSRKSDLTSVTFAGTGKLDNVDFTDTVPGFAADDLTVTLTWDAGVAKIYTNDVEFVKAEASGSYGVKLAPGTPEFKIAADLADGYAFNTFTSPTTIDPATVSSMDMTTFAVAAEFNGKKYAKLSDAIKDATNSGKVLSIAGNVVVDKTIEINGDLVIDLKGHNLSTSGSVPAPLVMLAGTLTISNTTAAVGIVYPGVEGSVYTEAESGVYVNVAGGQYEGSIYGDVTLTGGKFVEKGFTDYTVATGYKAVGPEAGYYTVVPETPVETTPFAIIIAGEPATTNYYETLQAAVNAAGTTVAEVTLPSVVTIMDDATLESTLNISKAITIDLNEKTITLAAGLATGINAVEADTLTVKNGTIASANDRANKSGSKAIYMLRTSGVFKDVNINIPGFEYGLTQMANLGDKGIDKNNYWTNATPYSLTCENVDVVGNGSLYHLEYTTATLDADCSASNDGVALASFGGTHESAIYSSCGSVVTIAGGSYKAPNALQTGNMGGKIVVNGGTFDGAIKSYMYENDKRYANNSATIQIVDGTFLGSVVFGTGMPGTCTKACVNWDIQGGTYSDLSIAQYATAGAVIKAANDTTADLANVVADITVDANGNVVTLAGTQTLNNNLTLICSGETAEKGFKNTADLTIAAGKTLDLSTLGWAEGVVGSDGASIKLEAGAVYKQKVNAYWDDAITSIFSTVEGYKITLTKDAGVATITAEEIPVSAITLDLSTVSIYVGDTSNVVATVVPSTAKQQTVTWDYSALKGFATAVVEGNTLKITGTTAQPDASSPMVVKAKIGEIEATCNVFVVAVPSAGPTSKTAGAEVAEETVAGGKVATVTTTDKTLTAVEVSGLGATTTVKVDGQINSIKGVGADNAIKVVSRDDAMVDITELCTVTRTGDTATIALDPTKCTPEIKAVTVGEDPVAPVSADNSVGIVTKPGLYYTLKAGNEPGAVTTAATAPTPAKGETMKLTADPAKFTPTGAKAFFKVEVTK